MGRHFFVLIESLEGLVQRMALLLAAALVVCVRAQSPRFLQTAPADRGDDNTTETEAPHAFEPAIERNASSNATLESEAAWYVRRSTASLTCSHWDEGFTGTCSGTIYGPCPGSGSYYTCSGTWSGANAEMVGSTSCNSCGVFASRRYVVRVLVMFLFGGCQGSFSQGGGHRQQTCIGRCFGGGEYSCSLSRTFGTSVHIACSSTCPNLP